MLAWTRPAGKSTPYSSRSDSLSRMGYHSRSSEHLKPRAGMSFDPIVLSFERTLRRDPLAPLVISPERQATVEEVDALARAALRALQGAGPVSLPIGTAVGLV